MWSIRTREVFGRQTALWAVPDITTLEMLLECNSVHCCSAFRRGLWFKIGKLDERMPCWMDYDFWIRAAAAGAVIRGLHGDHFYYRRHGRSLSETSRVLRGAIQAYLRRKHARLFSAAALDDFDPVVREHVGFFRSEGMPFGEPEFGPRT